MRYAVQSLMIVLWYTYGQNSVATSGINFFNPESENQIHKDLTTDIP